jgi:hypothetical protein
LVMILYLWLSTSGITGRYYHAETHWHSVLLSTCLGWPLSTVLLISASLISWDYMSKPCIGPSEISLLMSSLDDLSVAMCVVLNPLNITLSGHICPFLSGGVHFMKFNTQKFDVHMLIAIMYLWPFDMLSLSVQCSF